MYMIDLYLSRPGPYLLEMIGRKSHFGVSVFCQIYRVTDQALIAETMVWPIFFLMNVFFALKGSKLFIIIFDQKPGCTATADGQKLEMSEVRR